MIINSLDVCLILENFGGKFVRKGPDESLQRAQLLSSIHSFAVLVFGCHLHCHPFEFDNSTSPRRISKTPSGSYPSISVRVFRAKVKLLSGLGMPRHCCSFDSNLERLPVQSQIGHPMAMSLFGRSVLLNGAKGNRSMAEIRRLEAVIMIRTRIRLDPMYTAVMASSLSVRTFPFRRS